MDLDALHAVAWRDALDDAGFSESGLAMVLGTVAHAALERGETTPALRATTGGARLETLVRLFVLQARVSEAEAGRALPGLVPSLATAGVLQVAGGEVAARLDVRPYDGLLIASDPLPGLDGSRARMAADHVLGVSAAATSLHELAVRTPAESALDLGTGCGVLALQLSRWGRRVVATDVNNRAIDLTRLNAALNGRTLDLRAGSFFEPVAGERFDRILTNPPFVVGPAGGGLVYRDSGLAGDAAVEHVVRGAREHLTEGGTAQLLANWSIVRGRPWEERLTPWLAGYDAWVVQREVLDPAAYVEHWLRDAGLAGTPEYRERYDAWLDWFDAERIEAVGFGWVHLRRTDGPGRLRLERWPYEVALPLGDEVSAQLERLEALDGLDDRELRALRARRRDDVLQETYGTPGAEDPARIVLRQQRGLRRARDVDTATAALVGACDGELTIGQVADAVEQLTGTVVRTLLDDVRELLADGFLQP